MQLLPDVMVVKQQIIMAVSDIVIYINTQLVSHMTLTCVVWRLQSKGVNQIWNMI